MKLTDYAVVAALLDGKTVVREKGGQYDKVWLHGRVIEFYRREGNCTHVCKVPDNEMLFAEDWVVAE